MPIIVIIVFLILLIIPICVLVRFIGCIFSSELRGRVKKHPIIHTIWAIITILLIAGIYVPYFAGGVKPVPRCILCANNLKQIGQACALYSEENNGKWPNRLSDLAPTYLNDEKIIKCPIIKKQYNYVQPNSSSSSNTVVIYCEHPKPTHSVVLYKGGYVRIR